MSKQHPMPKFIKDWYEIRRQALPACCHTCLEYGTDGICEKHKMEPPEDFAATVDACNEYEPGVPF